MNQERWVRGEEGERRTRALRWLAHRGRLRVTMLGRDGRTESFRWRNDGPLARWVFQTVAGGAVQPKKGQAEPQAFRFLEAGVSLRSAWNEPEDRPDAVFEWDAGQGVPLLDAIEHFRAEHTPRRRPELRVA